jgi:hypothetical protein
VTHRHTTTVTADDLVARVATHHRLLLVAALGPVPSARSAWRAWCDAVVFDDVDGPAIRLLPILARRPEVLTADDPLHGRVRGLYRKAWVRNERLFAAASQAGDALSAAGVPQLHVEALPLAAAFGDHATRPLWDVDICVPHASVHGAARVLEGLGWRSEPRTVRARLGRRARHFVRGDDRLRLIDGVPWHGADPSAWETASDGDRPGELRLDLADAVVHAAIRAVQPWQPAPAQWVADVVRATGALGYSFPVDADDDAHLQRRADAHGVPGLVRAALTAAGEVTELRR